MKVYNSTIGHIPSGELDELIAEKVLGWKQDKGVWEPRPFAPRILTHELPSFSLDIFAAWQVVEKMTKDAYDFYLSGVSPHQQGWLATFDYGSYGKFVKRADTVPHAICLAALEAVGAIV